MTQMNALSRRQFRQNGFNEADYAWKAMENSFCVDFPYPPETPAYLLVLEQP